MLWTMKELFEHCSRNLTQLNNGNWAPARPLSGPFINRVKAAYAVLMGKADAFTWPGDQ